MNKKFIYSLCAAAFLMTGCDYNEDNFPGYDEGGRPTDVAKIVYTLTDADYDAMGKDVKKNKYFSADAMPDDYIPDWLAKTYLGADLNSSAKITYRFKTVYPKYNDIPYLQLTEEDYTIIHGEGYYGAYLNEDTESKMYKILNEKYADAEDGAFSFIEYQYNKDAKPEKVETPIAKYDFEDSFLIESAQRYDIKGKSYIETPKKYYFSDLGLRNARINFRQLEQTHSMENVIYNELRMRGYSVDVGVVPIAEKDLEGKVSEM